MLIDETNNQVPAILMLGITAMVVLVAAIILFVIFYHRKIALMHQRKGKKN